MPAGDEPEAAARDQFGLAPRPGDWLVTRVAVAPDNQDGPLDPGQLRIAEHVAGGLGALAAELLAQVAGYRPGKAGPPGAEVGGPD
jgi:hypothetical protein